ncbi:MAG: right-handed parallel beta-helix repeat-containing protein [Candidatus Electronema sp. V4]|uniref:right-handed parallel beta-helix repeat-containing protein n=1 Tax=Candidatus Electronema sp. V4 TaxID=3454756 RepID=UPI0040558D0A
MHNIRPSLYPVILATLTILFCDTIYAAVVPLNGKLYVIPHKTSKPGLELFVDHDGNDAANLGTKNSPFATLTRARDAIRAVKQASGLPDGGITVWVRGGLYEMKDSFTLSAQDSGSEGKPIVHRGYPGEVVRLVGAVRLDPSDFSLVTQTSSPDIWSRLDPVAQGHVYQLTLSAYRDDFGTLATREWWENDPAALELFFKGEPMQLSRWPDVDIQFPFETVAAAISTTQFIYNGSRPERWSKAEDIRLHGYWVHLWNEQYVSVSSIDYQNKIFTLSAAPKVAEDEKKPIAEGQPYYALNLLEEITQPGEWYLNRTTGIIYFWPPEPLDGKEIYVSVLGESLIAAEDVSHVKLCDLTLEMSRAELVRIINGSFVTIDNCILRNSGLSGVRMDGPNNFNNKINKTEIYNTGNEGIILASGNRYTLTAGNSSVINCNIHDFSRLVWTYTPAIRVYGAGNRVSNNLIHDAPHAAIIFEGNNHLIDYNEIKNVCRWSSDAGAVYSGRDWSYQGNKIKYNFIHHISTGFHGMAEDWRVHGVYLDDFISGTEVFGNTFYQISGGAIRNGGGRDNIIENNVIAKSGSAIEATNHGVCWITNDGGDSDMLKKIIPMNYKNDPWKTAYPRLAAIPNTWEELISPSARWLYPEGCVFSRNIGWMNSQWSKEEDWPTFESGCLVDAGSSAGVFAVYKDKSNNIENSDPLFVDEANLNLALRPDSPAYTIPGFQPIPFGQIGPNMNLSQNKPKQNN